MLGIEKKSWYFFRYQELVIDDENLSAYDKATYGAICKYADSKTGICYPSLKTLSKKAGCSKPRLIKSIKNLIEAGYIKKEKRQNEKKGNINNIYKVIDLSYLNQAIQYAKENNNEKLFNKIKTRLDSHPIPDYQEITTLVNEIDKGSKSDLQGVVNEINNPSKRDLHELEPSNYIKTEEEDARAKRKKIPDKIKQKFDQVFNRELSVELYEKMLKLYSDQKILLKALKVAEEKGDKPCYMLEILSDWQNKGLTSVSSVNTYLEERGAQKSNKRQNRSSPPNIDKSKTPKKSLDEMYEDGWR